MSSSWAAIDDDAFSAAVHWHWQWGVEFRDLVAICKPTTVCCCCCSFDAFDSDIYWNSHA